MADSLDGFINEIKQDLLSTVGLAMSESKFASKNEGEKEFWSFYTGGKKPKIYERTYQLLKSFKTWPDDDSGVEQGGNSFSYSLYVKEPHYGENANREKFRERGYGSTLGFDGYQVVNAANAGTHYIKGKPGFWDRTLIAAEKNLDRYMKKEISRKFG